MADCPHQFLIEAEGVCKIYNGSGPSVSVLNRVTLQVKRGELLVITGISGSGKTTLLNILGCLDRPNAGRVLFDGIDTRTLARDELAGLRGERIGFVFQHSHLMKHMTALENTILPFTLSGSRVDVQRGMTVLDAVGLADRAHHKPPQLSGGEQQRVAIARALVRKPDLIIADEPTGSLDRQTGIAVVELLATLVGGERGRSVVIVTHQPELLASPARKIQLADGQIGNA